MRADELARRLKDATDRAPQGEKVVSIYLFGIEHARELKDHNLQDIAEASRDGLTVARPEDPLAAFSRGEMTALDLRRRLDDATYGDVLRLLSERGLPLPRAPIAGREEQIARAHAWLFPHADRT